MNFKDLNNDDMVQQKIGNSPFTFSAIRPDRLGATEYTLVTIILDVSGSVSSFLTSLVTMVNAVVDACKKSPRANNLLIRLIKFNDQVEEVHGFILLQNITQYTELDFRCDGLTALFDATYSAVGGTLSYAKTLIDQDFEANGILYVITDGADNRSVCGPDTIKKEIEKSKSSEAIDSLTTVLIGINTTPENKNYLDHFHTEAGLTQYVDMGDATPGKLAKLGGMISKSISSTSGSIGQGATSASQLTI